MALSRHILELKMKATLVFASLVSVVLSGPAPLLVAVPEEDGGNMKYFLVETSEGQYAIEDLEHGELDIRSSSSDLTYHFFSRSNPTSSIAVTASGVTALRDTAFSASKDTIFIVHGWRNTEASAVNTYIRGALLPKYDVNVFVVDWSPIASRNYISAQGSVVAVGNFIGAFIQSLVTNYGLELSSVTLTGHSLGGHIVGNVGAALNGQVAQIVGLDPAGPLFSSSNTNNRLDPTDGQFVQVIHTNGGLLGMSNAIGDSDYYPNGGSSQPGCGIDLSGGCAHSRAYIYYAAAIVAADNRFVAWKCDSYGDFTRNRCTSNARSVLGGYGVDTGARGSYYLDTSSGQPYALG